MTGNHSLNNSNVDMVISIADMREIAVNEGNYSTMDALNNDLANPNNATFDVVHDWRNEAAADLVFLVFEGIQANAQAHEVCGSTFPCNSAFEQYAVAQHGLMRVAPVITIHELGRVMFSRCIPL